MDQEKDNVFVKKQWFIKSGDGKIEQYYDINMKKVPTSILQDRSQDQGPMGALSKQILKARNSPELSRSYLRIKLKIRNDSKGRSIS